MREIEDALRIAERSGDDLALAFARVTLGVALVHRQTDAERDRGQKLLAEVSEVFLRRGHNLCDLPIVEVYLARERARRGDRDEADTAHARRRRPSVPRGTAAGVGHSGDGCSGGDTARPRGPSGDVAEAEAAIERLAAAPADEGLVIRDIWLLRLRALLARAHGDAAAYTHLQGSLPRHGENAWLRGAYRVGRGDAIVASLGRTSRPLESRPSQSPRASRPSSQSFQVSRRLSRGRMMRRRSSSSNSSVEAREERRRCRRGFEGRGCGGAA